MKILIFSDTHLNLPFEEKKYNFLRSIIKPVDQVIINGDFWEGHLLKFQEFVQSPWKNLFPLLKSKNAIYIYGNHDERIYMNRNVDLFSAEQTPRYEVKIGNKVLILEHGDRLAYLKKSNPFMTKRSMQIERAVIRRVGSKFHKIVGGRLNKKIKRKLKAELKSNELYVCGHTHFAEIDSENQFVNSGIIRHGLGQYLLIENNRLQAKEEWYA